MRNATSVEATAVAREVDLESARARFAFDWRSDSGVIVKEMQNQMRSLDPVFIEEMIDLADAKGQDYLDAVKNAENAMKEHCRLKDWWHPRELLFALMTESVERLSCEGIRLTFSDKELLYAILSGVHAAKTINIPRVSLDEYESIMFPWKSVMNSYLSAESSGAPTESVNDFSIPFSDAPKRNVLAAPVEMPPMIEDHHRRIKDVLDMRYHISRMSLADIVDLADIADAGVAWSSGYAQAFMNALELVKLLPDTQSRILMAGYTISRVTVSALMERHEDELMKTIGAEGIDEVRNILIGTCVAAQSKPYVNHWQEYSMRDYETLIGPWLINIDVRAKGASLTKTAK